MNNGNRNCRLLSTIEQLLMNIVNNYRAPITPLSNIHKVCFVAISVAFLIKLSLDKHTWRPFFNAKLNLNHTCQLVILRVQKNATCCSEDVNKSDKRYRVEILWVLGSNGMLMREPGFLKSFGYNLVLAEASKCCSVVVQIVSIVMSRWWQMYLIMECIPLSQALAYLLVASSNFSSSLCGWCKPKMGTNHGPNSIFDGSSSIATVSFNLLGIEHKLESRHRECQLTKPTTQSVHS